MLLIIQRLSDKIWYNFLLENNILSALSNKWCREEDLNLHRHVLKFQVANITRHESHCQFIVGQFAYAVNLLLVNTPYLKHVKKN